MHGPKRVKNCCLGDELCVEWLADESGLGLVSRRDHCQRFSSLKTCDTPRARFEPAQSLSSFSVK